MWDMIIHFIRYVAVCNSLYVNLDDDQKVWKTMQQ